MKTKFGSIIVAGSGKIGGHVASKNRGGSYLRTKVTPSNPNTSYQTIVRNRFTGLSQAWRGLSQDERNAWNAAVVDFARTDIFGDLRNPSGINLYQRLNNILLLSGSDVLTTPPSPAAVEAINLVDVTATVVIPNLEIEISSAFADGTGIIISATAPMSAGKNSVKAAFRNIAFLGASVATDVDITTGYVAKFGGMGEIGQKIFVQVQPVNTVTGQVGGKTILSVITVA